MQPDDHSRDQRIPEPQLNSCAHLSVHRKRMPLDHTSAEYSPSAATRLSHGRLQTVPRIRSDYPSSQQRRGYDMRYTNDEYHSLQNRISTMGEMVEYQNLLHHNLCVLCTLSERSAWAVTRCAVSTVPSAVVLPYALRRCQTTSM